MEMLASEEEQQLRYISTSFPDEMKNHERRDLRQLVTEYEEILTCKVNDARKTALKAFRNEAKAYFKEVRKQMKQQDAEQKAAEKAMKKAEKNDKPGNDGKSGKDQKKQKDEPKSGKNKKKA